MTDLGAAWILFFARCCWSGRSSLGRRGGFKLPIPGRRSRSPRSTPGFITSRRRIWPRLIGVSSNDVQSRILQGNWQLLNQGQPAGWLAGSNGMDLIFYAQALRNNYTTNNVYWLVDGTNAAPASVDGGFPAAVSGTWYPAATNCEQDLYCEYQLGTDPDSNYWYWANLVATHPLRGSFSVTVPLDALGGTSAQAQITVRVCGVTTNDQCRGLVRERDDQCRVGGTWMGAVPAVFTFNFPASLLNVGNNTIQFTALGTPLTQWWLNGFCAPISAALPGGGGSLAMQRQFQRGGHADRFQQQPHHRAGREPAAGAGGGDESFGGNQRRAMAGQLRAGGRATPIIPWPNRAAC